MALNCMVKSLREAKERKAMQHLIILPLRRQSAVVRTAVHLFQLSHSPHVQQGPMLFCHAKGMFRSGHPVQAVIYEEVEAINTDTDNSPMNGSQQTR